MAPHVDKSITNLYDRVHSEIHVLYQKTWLRDLAKNVDDESIKIFDEKTTFVNTLVKDVLANEKCAILMSDLLASRIQNWKYLLKLPQVFVILRIIINYLINLIL